MIKINIIPTLLLLALIGCSSGPFRSPSSDQGSRLFNFLDAIEQRFQTSMNLKECSEQTNIFHQESYKMNFKTSGALYLSTDEMQSLVKKSFKTRLSILSYLKNIEPSWESEDCVNGIRNLIRTLRDMEDYGVERVEADLESMPALTGEGTHFLVNPKFSFKSYDDLQSGDVIISRGNAYTSAAISRIGNVDTQFSHASFVYKNSKGELFTTEAHIEIGNVALPFSAHLAEGNARAVVFRYKDAQLAHRAAKFMYEKVKVYTDKNNKNINYDFGMDYKDDSDLFCSEVIFDGFDEASKGKVDIPQHKTTFDKRLMPFLNQIGIKVSHANIKRFKTFAPGDLEFDNRFELVAEWRDPTKVTDLRIKDAILTKMYEWMMEKKYRFRPGIKVRSKSYFGYLARRVPLLRKSFIEKFPLNMKPKQLRLFVVLDIVAAELEKEVKSRKNYKQLSFKEIQDVLETFREYDRRDHRKLFGRSKFHRHFRP